MTAKELRLALIDAIARLPVSLGPFNKREAVRNWHQQVIRYVFQRRSSISKREHELLSNILPGRALDPHAIMPEIIPCRTEEDHLVFTYFSLWSSFPTFDCPGRRMKFLIRDLGHENHPLMGICCLSSPVRQLHTRDEWIGWSGSEYRMIRRRRLVHIADLSTCISMPPYSFLTGGKLLAGLMTSNETRTFYRTRYKDQLTLRQRLRADELYLLITSGCYGSNTPLYKGLKYEGRPLYRFLGYSRGYSHFQIDPLLYEQVKNFVQRRRPDMKGQFRTWCNSKLRVLRIAARELKIPEELLVFTGHRRALFAAPLVENWRELLLGNAARSKPICYPAQEIVDYWKKIWVSRRLKNAAAAKAIDSFTPEQARISRFLE